MRAGLRRNRRGLRCPGKPRDKESGLDDFGFRSYSKDLGRWIGPDQPFADNHIENPQSWNLYSYCFNCPVNAIDIKGRSTFLLTWKPLRSQVGHSAIAVSIRNADGIETGEFQLRDRWPDETSSKNSKKAGKGMPADASYPHYGKMAKEELFEFNGGQVRPADGVIEIKTNAEEEKTITATLDAEESKDYSFLSSNCSSYTAAALKSIGFAILPQVFTCPLMLPMTPNLLPITVTLETPIGNHESVKNSGDSRVDTMKDIDKK